ncbi:hypothetical protein CFK39_09530 [Brachybacterium avium]|uniref:Ligase n=1 Tax=Brachybacterium avium TaxID=2017485 RepID=A0A220UCT6_9MICO|nr:hypothetical protein [Brachybacterium avium]ASK66018.1 hypothetical protein CFK39_09530 [Brachybacterium avium]
MITAAPTALLALGALAALVIAVIVLRAVPKGAVVAWAVVLFLVPVWVGVSIGFFWYGITVLTAVLLIVLWAKVPLHPADGWIAAFLVVLSAMFVLKGVTLSVTVTAVLEWVVPYVWGRIIIARVDERWVMRTIAGVAVAAALLGIIEFSTSFNPWVLIPGPEPLYSTWSELQPRGGVLRVEGAFGHSIALGTTLAMSSAFVIAARWRPALTMLALSTLTAAVVLTFSRTGLVSLVLTVVLSVLLLPGLSRRLRAGVVGLGVVAVAVVVPVLDSVLGAAGEEADGSAGYRADLLVLLRQVDLFGNAGDWTSLVSGDQYLGYFARSTDNALLSIMLKIGAVPTLLLVAAIIGAVLMVFRRRGRSPAAIAVVGQLPSLVVVAMITQYGTFFWFCVGLAIASGTRTGDRSEDDLGPVRAGREPENRSRFGPGVSHDR